MMVPASILTVTEAEDGIEVSVNEGIVKIFGRQLSRKKPMVAAVSGSVGFGLEAGGAGTVSCGGDGGGAESPGFFLHEKIKPVIKRNAIKRKDLID
jgi:hypothetical protein